MCVRGDAAGACNLDLIASAREAADSLLDEVFDFGAIAKARMNLNTPAGFDRAVAVLGSGLRRLAAQTERDAVAEALRALDVDWPNTTATQRRDLVSRAFERAGRVLAPIPTRIGEKLDKVAPDVWRAGRRSAARQGLDISTSFGEADRVAARATRKSSVLFVSDEMGRRASQFSDEARRIVSEGMEAGLGRGEIKERLAQAAGSTISRSATYWEVVAGAFVSRGHTWSQMLGYQEAGIERYQIESVLDERTTNICRFLHGKVFSVQSGMRGLRDGDALEEPEKIKQHTPWVREGRDGAGRHHLFVDKGGGRKVRLATIERSAVGRADDTGRFSRAMGSKQLATTGVGFPPYHGLCRTTTVPVF